MRRIFAIVILITIFFIACTKEVPPSSPSSVTSSAPPPSNPLQPPGVPIVALQYNSNLIIGGDGFIAQYNGTSWHTLASVRGYINALEIYSGNLIVGGSFDSIEGVSANNIALWNGSNWLALGSGTSGAVTTLAVYNYKLVCGGKFNDAGGMSVNNIAQWNGSNWSAMATGIGNSYYPNTLIIYNGNLIEGGVNGQIQSWNGVGWSILGSFSNQSSVSALAVYQGNLIEGGLNNSILSPTSYEKWDGVTWSSFDSIPSSEGNTALIIYDGNLIFASSYCLDAKFWSASVNEWNGSTLFEDIYVSEWIDGFNYIQGFAIYNGNLIVLGYYPNGLGSGIGSYNGSTWTQL